ncbi:MULTISPECIES: integrase domain-containing protein [unclassified Gilliamella]|uniref:integrase domain-containing protein n=1 Tax=unclassified Gilliamella TaxID=2685620 RepID=UPI00226A2D79|nr:MULTISPECIES: integrase domain-containing protein [unclassified Gilliamella]MCX8573918.1 tyrosine-type recombinase/integrase [Gilliamella sp. B3831]MCX8576149.1 tyrosine-type recombinase/integrase [Gilliamella sp. B3815]MCX8603250.1 tyrosine-type recombinase/integrase [Gilliamella sp. B3823]MCX8607133.1 tyrosine-type recombinase/integrase [Gilliamella sp. B3825]MCX8636651.1 tyrosine-type recombinase/integrase [Gilliamella sp. B3817]
MPKKVTPITDTQIKNAKAQSKDYPIYDGNGLLLLIKSTGVKIWQFRYYRPITNNRTTVSFGSYPEVSLQQARKQRDEARELIKQGIDPQHHKAEQEQRKQESCNNTFYTMAEKWFKFKSEQGLEEKTLKKAWRSLENHVFPYIKDIPINQVTAIKTINALQPLHNNNKYETVKRICGRINEIMYYAVNMGIIDNNPVAKITNVFNSPKAKNHPTIPTAELPQFMQALSMANINLQTRCVIEWQLLTLTRPSEAVSARWDEIDLDKKLWSIPAEQMKMDRPHNIPLSPQAIKILEIMKSIKPNSEFVFPTARPPYNRPMNSQTPNTAIKRMGFKDKLVAHGLRSLASTTLNEQGFDDDVVESALSHLDKNAVRRAYNRAEYIPQKRVMLDWWGNFVEKSSQANVSLSGYRNLSVINM